MAVNMVHVASRAVTTHPNDAIHPAPVQSRHGPVDHLTGEPKTYSHPSDGVESTKSDRFRAPDGQVRMRLIGGDFYVRRTLLEQSGSIVYVSLPFNILRSTVLFLLGPSPCNIFFSFLALPSLDRLKNLVPDTEECQYFLPDASHDNRQQTYSLPQRATAFREVRKTIIHVFCSCGFPVSSRLCRKLGYHAVFIPTTVVVLCMVP